MRPCVYLCAALLIITSAAAWSAPTYSWELTASFADLSRQPSSNDVIQGKNVTNGGAVIESGGFHWAFPDQADAKYLTDGIYGANVHSVLHDYAFPSLKIRYEFDPTPVWEILSFGGNPDKNGRVFQNVDVEVKVAGDWFEIIHEATTGPYYVHNGGRWEASLIRIYDDSGGMLLDGLPIEGVRLTYWSPDNTQDWFLPRTEPNAICASIIKEIDVVVPEPATVIGLLIGVGGVLARRRNK
ncbi:MAG: PEP-CTERM sorting domain-containing protein [Armatimonadota bacterium]|nr:PEP-CTERM sorting domain-containing protein [Armatimonadota bacterium]